MKNINYEIGGKIQQKYRGITLGDMWVLLSTYNSWNNVSDIVWTHSMRIINSFIYNKCRDIKIAFEEQF